METFHIVLLAIFAAGTVGQITMLCIIPNYQLLSAFNLGMMFLLYIIFYAVAAYSIMTTNYALFWANVIFNIAIGAWNTRRLMNDQYSSVDEHSSM